MSARRQRMPLQVRARGLTLIELMVALAVFAILGTLTWRGTAQLVDGGAAVDRELERWREISRALQVIENELLQVVAPAGATDASPPLRWTARGDYRELALLGLAGGGGGPERIAFRHTGERIEWHRRPDLHEGAAVETDVLLDGVLGLSARFFANGQWRAQWPQPGAAALPRAVEIRLVLADHGEISRIHALR